MEPFPCPQCGVTLILPEHYAGRKLLCPSCQKEIQVPAIAPGERQANDASRAVAARLGHVVTAGS